MKTTLTLTFLALMATTACFAQAPAPIPTRPAVQCDPEDEGCDPHASQPEFCVNHGTAYVHNCACKGMDGQCAPAGSKGGESKTCSVYCRKTACRCRDACATSRVLRRNVPWITVLLAAFTVPCLPWLLGAR